MYEVTLKGNFNVPVEDLGLTFSPHTPVHLLSDEDFKGSAVVQRFLGRYLSARRLTDEAPTTASAPVVDRAKQAGVVELPSKPVEETEVVRADGAAARSAANQAPAAPSAQVDDAKADDAVVHADGAAKRSAEVVPQPQAEAVKPEPKAEVKAEVVEAEPKVEVEPKAEVKAEVVEAEPKVEVKPEVEPKAEVKVEVKAVEKPVVKKQPPSKKPAKKPVKKNDAPKAIQ